MALRVIWQYMDRSVTKKILYGSLIFLGDEPVLGRCMSHLCYLCLFVYIGVQHILCCVCVLFSFVHYVASSSGLSILNCPFGFL